MSQQQRMEQRPLLMLSFVAEYKCAQTRLEMMLKESPDPCEGHKTGDCV